MNATPYELGLERGREECAQLSREGSPIVPAYLEARQEAHDWRTLPIMSDALTRANRRARAFALGYLRGFRSVR